MTAERLERAAIIVIIALAICADGLMDKLGVGGFLVVSGLVVGLAAGLRYLSGRKTVTGDGFAADTLHDGLMSVFATIHPEDQRTLYEATRAMNAKGKAAPGDDRKKEEHTT